MNPDETPTPAPEGAKPESDKPPQASPTPAEAVNDDPLFDPSERRHAPTPDPKPDPKSEQPAPARQQAAATQRADPKQEFPDIPMPGGARVGGMRARDGRINLDLDLGRIKRRKRYGFLITVVSVLFIAFVLAPVTWVGLYRFVDPPSNVLMMQRAAAGAAIKHYSVPLNRVSPHLIRSVIAAEDNNFCTHSGFDIEAIEGAMRSNARGRRTRGASTISQQVAKNLFLWPERSWLRKGLESYFTALIEFMWPKRRIMEAYLNIAEWGDGAFGAEAAARTRFGVSAADLTPLQAARLAAVLPNPNRWRADSPGPYVRRRAATLVQRARVVRNEHLAGCVLILDRAPDARRNTQ